MILLVLAVCASAGCGLSEPVVLEQDPAMADVRAGLAGPRAWALRPAAAVLAVPEGGGAGDEFPLSMDPDNLLAEAVDALELSGIFKAVEERATVVGEERPGMAPSSDFGARSWPLDLSLKITRATGSFEGRNGYFLPGFALWWLLSPLAACAVPDEDYAAGLAVEAVLMDPQSGEKVWGATLEASFTGSLDHFQRSIGFFDLLPPGPILATHDPDSVSALLLPHVCRRFEIELARRLSAELPPPVVDVLVVLDSSTVSPARPASGSGAGVGGTMSEPRASASGQPASTAQPGDKGNRRPSDQDALVAAFLERPGKPAVVRIDASAGAGEIRDRLAEIAGCAGLVIRDLLVFYCGPGTLVEEQKGKWEAALAVGAQHAAPLRVSALANWIQSIPARSRLVILDSGFFGEGGRAVAGSPGPQVAESDILPYPSGKGVPAILSVCGPCEAGCAVEPGVRRGEEEKRAEGEGGLPSSPPPLFPSSSGTRGVLCLHLLPLLGPSGDKDRDGRVEASEVFDDLAWALSRKLRLSGGTALEPVLTADAALWRFAAKEDKAGDGAGARKGEEEKR